VTAAADTPPSAAFGFESRIDLLRVQKLRMRTAAPHASTTANASSAITSALEFGAVPHLLIPVHLRPRATTADSAGVPAASVEG
jgi:hypothetical protein